MKIYLLGVYHNFETETHHNFKEYIVDTCSLHDIRSIAEEMSYDGLNDAGVTVSTIKTIADNLGLPHAYCGLGRKEREALGILGSQQIEILGRFYEWSDEKVRQKKLDDYAKRERVWLERLKDMFQDPMLFVCGIDHLDTFGSLLRRSNYACEILEKRWQSNQMDSGLNDS